jgi:hypothetical protein
MKKPHKQRIILTELSMTGVFHAAVNTGFIRWIQAENPGAELHFRGERSHTNICQEKLEDERVQFGKFPFFPRANKWTLPVRDFLGSIYGAGLLLGCRKKDTLFITNLLPITHWVIFGLNEFLRRRLFIALHGQLEALLPDTSLGWTKCYFRLHGPLLHRDRRNRYVILGQPIHDAIKKWLGINLQPLIIDHPHQANEENPQPPVEIPLRFGQIGAGNRGKGTERLFQLGELLREEIEAGKVELRLVGRLDPELRCQVNPWVTWYEKPLSEADYRMNINALHCALFLRDAQMGRAVPSGSFFDAVQGGKPFLSLRHPYVEYYADRFPERGTFCESVEEMAEAIRKWIKTC